MDNTSITNKTFGWRCSPNIAIVKYWGKLPGQRPASPSVSMTLKESATETTVSFTSEKGLSFTFNGHPSEEFAQRIEKYFAALSNELPWLSKVGAVVESRNNFPHSAGIASSASAFGALALCLAEAHVALGFIPEEQFYAKASHLARLGSGSAARSVYGGFTLWGQTNALEGSSDEVAIPLEPVHDVYSDLHDLIVVVSDQKKNVSSSAGHSLMAGHPFAAERYRQAHQRAEALPSILRDGDLAAFSRITIAEGLGLHALMLTSDPPVNLLEPLSVEVIRCADRFRTATGLPLAYTLDAGPNVHLIYPDYMAEHMQLFTTQYLLPLGDQVKLIHDRMGKGPQRLSMAK